jgi:DNA-binding CsgD family transcriptional regulator/predicted negative regulator of RcsB-dependent stress response
MLCPMAAGGFDEALRSWVAGDPERALALCETLPVQEAASTRAVLLRARALLRLRRPRESIALVESLDLQQENAAERATAAMLLGTAYARSGDVERGLAVLRDAAALAVRVDVAIGSEIALGIALAHYQRRDFDAAARALDGVDPTSGIVYARALECRGWIAKSKNDFAAAVAAFEASLAQVERSGQSDRFLEANLIATMSYIAVELLDVPRCEALLERARRVQWESSGLEYYRFWLEMNRSMADEIAGRPREALQAARNAALYAPSDAFRLFAQCRRAAVLFSYGEMLGFADLAGSISADFASIDLRLLHEFEEINLPVVVAETLALIGDGAGAAAALRRLDTMSPAQLALLHDEPMKRAYFAFVEGLVDDANKEPLRARHRYREALREFDAIGMTRRALLAALRLNALHADDALLAFIREQALALPAGSWIREKSARLSAWNSDPMLAQLTRAEREVLELLYEGKSTAEIAAVRTRSTQTIRNTVSKLLQTFAVDNRQALLNECARRGAFPTATS